jgi:hypothetical protein
VLLDARETNHTGSEESSGGDAALPRLDWREVDRQLRRIAARRCALDAEEARWLLAGRRAEVHLPFGFATFYEYVERVLGYAPHSIRERLRVAEALERLPATREALAAGQASFTAVREITRVATPETEREWLRSIAGKTVREVEDLVAGHAPGDRPTDPADPDLEPRVLRLELTPDVYALFLETRRHLEDMTGERLTDSDLVRAMCEASLDDGGAGASEGGGGRSDGGRRAAEMVVTVCESCERGTVDVAGQTIAISDDAIDEVRCDVSATRDVPRGTRRLVWRRDHQRCSVPGCRGFRWLHLHHIVPRSQDGTHDAWNLTLLCSAHHRALHDGRLFIRGRAPDTLEFTHADGSRYGGPEQAVLDLFGEVAVAIGGMGMKPLEARVAVERARSHVGPDSTLEEVIDACLRECASARARDGC